MKNTVIQIAILLVAALALGLGWNYFNKNGLPVTKNHLKERPSSANGDAKDGGATKPPAVVSNSISGADPAPPAPGMNGASNQGTTQEPPVAAATGASAKSDKSDAECEEPEGVDEWVEDGNNFISLKKGVEYHEMIADGQVAFLDARKEEDYAEGHIVGALPVYHAQRDRLLKPHLEKLKDVVFLIVYCPGGDCEDSIYLANALADDYGFISENIFILKCGYTHWEKRGYPTEKGN